MQNSGPSETLDNNFNKILNGLALDDNIRELCDFTVAEQNTVSEAQGVAPSAPSDYVPKLGDTVTYIVVCVLINERDEVLMIQEAKESCVGKWYLPAGRMESGELIVDAAIRETFEETGLICDVTTMLVVESASGSWFRFVVTGKITGGELKTIARADKESLQAMWVADLSDVLLRAKDITYIVDRARSYYQPHIDNNWHPDILPARKPHSKNLLRLVIIIKKRATNRVHLLLSEKTALHFPTAEIHPARNVHSTLRRFMTDLFGAELPQHRPSGIISVEHDATQPQSDGICLTLLVVFRPALEEVPIIGKCIWYELSKEMGERFLGLVSSRSSTVLLHVVR